MIVVLVAAPSLAVAGPSGPPYPEVVWYAQGRLAMGYALGRHSTVAPRPGQLGQVAISHDGKYVAFLWHGEQKGYAVPPNHLWLASFCYRTPALPPPNCHPQEISSIGTVSAFSWSPSSDQLLAETNSGKTWLVNARGVVRKLPPEIENLPVWSPNGRTIAITQLSNHRVYLDLVRNGVVSRRTVPELARDAIPLPATFWGENHLLYWVDPMASASIAADGMQLVDLNLRTDRIRRLGVMLGYQDWLTVSGSRLLMVRGDIRSAFFHKFVQLCYLNGPCQRIAGIPKGDISIDPAWSPDGRHLLFVTARAWDTWGFQLNARYRNWLQSHVLWVANGNGTGAHPLAVRCQGMQCVRGALHGKIHGVDDPEWTPGGIVFERLGGLWFLRGLRAKNVLPIGTITTQLVPNLKNSAYDGWYYGHMDWRQLFDARGA